MKIVSYIKKKVQKLTSDQRLTLSILVFALLCIYPWRDGYIMLLDYVSIPWDDYSDRLFWYTGLFPSLLAIIWDVFWAMGLQYLLFTWALLCIWLGSKRLLTALGLRSWWLRFGVLFALCNPFIYTRMIEWQANVFMWFALIYMAMSFLAQGIVTNTSKYWMIWYIVFAGLGVSYMHHAIFFVLLLSTWVVLLDDDMRKNLRRYCLLIWWVLLINLNRITAAVMWVWRNAQTMSFFGGDHIRAFAAVSPDTNVPFHLLSLHGFWWEHMWRFTNLYSLNTNREYIFLCIALLVCVGIYAIFMGIHKGGIHIYTKKPAWWVWLLWVAVLAYLLSMWTSGRWWVRSVSDWMYEYIPFYIGLREPQKRTWVLLFCYMIFASIWVQASIGILRFYTSTDKFWEYLLAIVIMLLPLLYTPTMLFALGGQLSVHTYPDSRYQSKDFLHSRTYTQDCLDTACYDVLVFPRHQYIRLSWSRNVIANPMQRFLMYKKDLTLSILAGDNMEMKEIYTQSSRPASKIIETYVWPEWYWWLVWSGNIDSQKYSLFIQDALSLGIEDIVLFKEAKRLEYQFHMDEMEELWLLERVLENDMVQIYTIVK